MFASWDGKLDADEQDIDVSQFGTDSLSTDNSSSAYKFEHSNGPVAVKNDLFDSKSQTNKNQTIKVEEDEDSDIADNNDSDKKSKRMFNFGLKSVFNKNGTKNNSDQQSKSNSTLLSKFKKLAIIGKRKTEFDDHASAASNDTIQLDEKSVSFNRDSPCPFGCRNCGASFDKVETLATHLKLGHCRKRINSAFSNDFEDSVSHEGSISATFSSVNSQKRKQRPKSQNAALAGDAEFKCKLCQKTFAYKWNLQRHMKVHEPEKKFSCEVCGKKFRHKGNVKIHMAKHTKEERYQCTKCGRKFSWHSSLKRHRCIPNNNNH